LASYKEILAITFVWNGPLGVSEMNPFAEGTVAMAKTVSDLDAVTVVGVGDTAAAVSSSGGLDRERNRLERSLGTSK
jgi:phosphoglycerate kinase